MWKLNYPDELSLERNKLGLVEHMQDIAKMGAMCVTHRH
jgi:hypothetical protein